MQTKFRRHQKVKILRVPDIEYVEYHDTLEENEKKPEIKPGMKGEVNVILPNGQYHVEIFSDEGKSIAYAPFDEDSIESVEEAEE